MLLFVNLIFAAFAFFSTEIECAMVKGSSVEDNFKQCLLSRPQVALSYCVGLGTISKLQSWDDDPEFDLVDGLTLSRDAQQVREVYNFAERDPNDYRFIAESLTHVLSKRSLRWDMGFLYPGLSLRMAPSVSAGGVLEFILDPHREAVNQQSLKQASTGRILARQLLVPLLLGFKFNVVTLVPLLFGLLALIAKKAVIISKIALVVTSALGLGSLLIGNAGGVGGGNRFPTNQGGGGGGGGGGGFNPAFGGQGTYGFGNNQGGYNRYPDEELLYRESGSPTEDELRLLGNMKLQNVYQSKKREDVKTTGRNFAWSEADKT